MERLKDNHNIVYQLLIEPRFKLFRHITLFCIVCLIVLNQFLLVYSNAANEINPFPILGSYLFIYLFFIYLNLYTLIPKLLLRNRHFDYLLMLLLTAISITVATICMEYFIHHFYRIPFCQYSFFSSRSIPFWEFLSNTFLTTILLLGISITAFFKNWLLSIEQEEEMKKKNLHTQLDGLKEQVTPSFLLNVLHKAGELTETNPTKSSEVLLKLSRLLRYQLYDSARDAVLLRAEINFLSDYLSLENYCNENLSYKITYPPFEKSYFIAPLSFTFVVEEALKRLRMQKKETWIELKFAIAGDSVIFTCTNNLNQISNKCDLLKT